MIRTLWIASGLALTVALAPGVAFAEPSGVILEIRPRYESAGQSGAADADALGVRTRLGWRSGEWRGFQGIIEFDDITALSGDYNDGVPPTEPYATIADPEVTELNRLQVSWAPSEQFSATLGRQRITFDDQRFIGASNWRQDDQTFDAVRFDTRHGALQAGYVYVDHVNRVFGDDVDWESQSHLFNGSYTLSPALKLTAFAYALDFQAIAVAQSNVTYGVRASGAYAFGAARVTYAASYATQSDYADNPFSYDADYWAVDASLALHGFTARAGYESLEGEGANRRFQTPLATLHIFQGWADVFLATPADGVEDFYVSGGYQLPVEMEYFSNAAGTIVWHEFEAERTGADLGEEFDAQFTAAITPRVSIVAKYADYDGPGAPSDTTRAWFGMEFKL